MHPSFTFHVLRLDPLMISHPPTQFPGSATVQTNSSAPHFEFTSSAYDYRMSMLTVMFVLRQFLKIHMLLQLIFFPHCAL